MTVAERRRQSAGVSRVTHAIPNVAFLVAVGGDAAVVMMEQAELETSIGRMLRLERAYDDPVRDYTVVEFSVVDRD